MDATDSIERTPMHKPDRFQGATPKSQEGKAGYVLAWLLGVPIPILLLIFLLRGCN